MLKEFYLYLLTVPIFFGIDILWISIMNKRFYSKNLAHLVSEKINWPAAIIFYLLYIAGIIVFAVLPATRDNSPIKALLLGGFLGLIAYSTYDLSNLSTLKNWPINVTVVDIIWGTILTASVSFLSYYVSTWIK